MRVWIDQDQCTGDGLCEETCSKVFMMGNDGLAYVHGDVVPEDWEDAAVEAAETCPGECIFVEA
jgi:ferredoxin